MLFRTRHTQAVIDSFVDWASQQGLPLKELWGVALKAETDGVWKAAEARAIPPFLDRG
jgi:hypothetical protein